MSLKRDVHPGVRIGLQVVAFGVAAAFVGLFALQPRTASLANAAYYAPDNAVGSSASQSLATSGSASSTVSRDGYQVTEPPAPEPVVAPVAVTSGSGSSSSSGSAGAPADCRALSVPQPGPPEPGTPKDAGYQAVLAHGWDVQEYYYLLALWNRESGWNPSAENTSSGAYGIPQALPGSKMAAFGDDWQTNPATQIAWGLSYISGRYGTPCEAWASSEERGWY
ncbi:lytic transglycosylase domain-containing protein [Humibacter sp. BT305]|uniref:aggregation-promoting factor C-terminal-like domain-containing protein n=1 Tax=Cnuibacter physcomitrellae TaxID=1619308 RepID=UPI000E107506|nr:transglycosylase SLT domain-containing protein [Cnuibacter physcomitrellae]AXH36499.1 lytic transglycosylase domain-containing protein [Humibacter sp. BT305]MCS5499057.1 transglycosylase SLT domain-containing protein [Cnuibacter physcomitrellae]